MRRCLAPLGLLISIANYPLPAGATEQQRKNECAAEAMLFEEYTAAGVRVGLLTHPDALRIAAELEDYFSASSRLGLTTTEKTAALREITEILFVRRGEYERQLSNWQFLDVYRGIAGVVDGCIEEFDVDTDRLLQ